MYLDHMFTDSTSMHMTQNGTGNRTCGEIGFELETSTFHVSIDSAEEDGTFIELACEQEDAYVASWED